MSTNSIKLLAGNSHPGLAELISQRLGVPLSKVGVYQYSNKETSVTIGKVFVMKTYISSKLVTGNMKSTIS